MRIKMIVFGVLIVLFFGVYSSCVQASNLEESVQDTNDYSAIQEAIDDSMVSDHAFDFGQFVSDLVESKDVFSIKKIFGGMKDAVVNEVKSNVELLGRLIAIAIVAAIFTNFASVFMDNQVAETGFYITYILLFTIIITSFQTVSHLAQTTVKSVLEFVKILMPAYFMSVTMSTGATTSILFYELTLGAITLVNVLLLNIILPMIHVYLIILLADNLSKEEKLSKLAKTLGTVIKWGIRSLVVLVIGFNMIQSLIAPAADGVKRSILIKMGGVIPGVGNLLSGVAETVVGASILLKNAIGVAGLVAILVICAVPLIRLIIYYFIYRICESVAQPVSDKRILKCIDACSTAVSMLIQLVIVTAIMFIISITIVTASTTMFR